MNARSPLATAADSRGTEDEQRRARIEARMARFYERAAAGKVRERRPKRKPKPREFPLEREEQAAVCDWLRERGILHYAVPNGSYFGDDSTDRAIRWGMLRKAGASAGVPDLCIIDAPPAGKDARGVYLEMKRVREAKPTVSDDQHKWHARLRRRGFIVLVAYGRADAIQQLTALGYGHGMIPDHDDPNNMEQPHVTGRR